MACDYNAFMESAPILTSTAAAKPAPSHTPSHPHDVIVVYVHTCKHVREE